MYKYQVRPGYGSKKLLIEFSPEKADETFLGCILRALETIKVDPMEIVDLWMNDQTIWNMKSHVGEFEISIDIWDMVFIHAEENQQIIKIIDGLLEKDASFTRESVDFNKYR